MIIRESYSRRDVEGCSGRRGDISTYHAHTTRSGKERGDSAEMSFLHRKAIGAIPVSTWQMTATGSLGAYHSGCDSDNCPIDMHRRRCAYRLPQILRMQLAAAARRFDLSQAHRQCRRDYARPALSSQAQDRAFHPDDEISLNRHLPSCTTRCWRLGGWRRIYGPGGAHAIPGDAACGTAGRPNAAAHSAGAFRTAVPATSSRVRQPQRAARAGNTRSRLSALMAQTYGGLSPRLEAKP